MTARKPAPARGRSFPCPFCPRLFANPTDLLQHIKAKRAVSAAHGLPEPAAVEPARQQQQEARP